MRKEPVKFPGIVLGSIFENRKKRKKTQQKRSKVKLWKKMTLKTEEQFIKEEISKTSIRKRKKREQADQGGKGVRRMPCHS